MKHFAIIVAGGSGTRFGAEMPKQFLELNGKPLLMHTLQTFENALDEVDGELILVLPVPHIAWWKELCLQYAFDVRHRVVEGGDSRFQSVKNALETLNAAADDLIAVHDGVRPLVTSRLIGEAFDAAAKVGAVVPAVPVTDSIRMIQNDGSSHALQRAALRAVQTPQAFSAKLLIDAYAVPFSAQFTDDASVVEHAGYPITIINGEKNNIKITHPIDLKVASLILADTLR